MATTEAVPNRREKKIGRTILRAILYDDEADKQLRLWRPIKTFFKLYGIILTRTRPEVFRRLRNQSWGMSEDGYKSSFEDNNSLVPKGDMGYSGSVSSRIPITRKSSTFTDNKPLGTDILRDKR